MKNKFIIMNEKDNCATSLEVISEGEEIVDNNASKIRILKNIPMGHKFALKGIRKGEKIVKYAEIIGIATEDINKGDWIHTHNIKSAYMEVVKSG